MTQDEMWEKENLHKNVRHVTGSGGPKILTIFLKNHNYLVVK